MGCAPWNPGPTALRMMDRLPRPSERRSVVNGFVEHHRESIQFQYACFDRVLLHAIIQPLQRPPIIVGFLDRYRHVPSITKASFRRVSEDDHRGVERLAQSRGLRIVEPPKGVRRELWVAPFYDALGARDGIAV